MSACHCVCVVISACVCLRLCTSARLSLCTLTCVALALVPLGPLGARGRWPCRTPSCGVGTARASGWRPAGWPTSPSCPADGPSPLPPLRPSHPGLLSPVCTLSLETGQGTALRVCGTRACPQDILQQDCGGHSCFFEFEKRSVLYSFEKTFKPIEFCFKVENGGLSILMEAVHVK